MRPVRTRSRSSAWGAPSWTKLLLGCGFASLGWSCSKSQGDAAATAPATATGAAEPATQAPQDTPAASLAPPTAAAEATATSTTGAASAALDCSQPEQWQTVALKALQTGEMQIPKADIPVPPLEWQPCEGMTGCERPKLPEGSTVLGVGAHGNTLRVAWSHTCGDDAQLLRVAGIDGKPAVTLRGVNFVFETAALGGDRLLVGGFAKHMTPKATHGYVKREYLLTVRDYGGGKLEAARNKAGFVPHAASSQLVHVRGSTQCTGLFWKIGVEDCNFAGPGTDTFALIGSNMIYADPATSKAMAWDVKNGPRVLLDDLQWITTDGVNVVWASAGQLFTTQPRWDLPELKATPAPGSAGPKPLAYGCGRLLHQGTSGWTLRDVAKGLEWTLDPERFPASVASGSSPSVMNCEFLLTPTGERIALKNLGKPKPLGDATDAPGSEPAPSLPAAPTAAAPPSSAKPPAPTTTPAPTATP